MGSRKGEGSGGEGAEELRGWGPAEAIEDLELRRWDLRELKS